MASMQKTLLVFSRGSFDRVFYIIPPYLGRMNYE